MMGEGFVNQAYRDMVNWPFYHDVPMRLLFDHLLRMAAWEEHVANGSILIPAGGMLIQVEKLAKDNDLTVEQVRYALKKLASSNEISIIHYKTRGSLIVVTRWEDYHQSIPTQIPSQFPTQIPSQAQNHRIQQKVENDNVTDVIQNSSQNNSHSNSQSISHSNSQSKKTENEEIPPTPPKEDKEKKEHTSQDENASVDSGSKQMEFSFDGMTDEPPVKTSPKASKGKAKNRKLTYNKQTHKIEGITKEDKENWHQKFPYLDIDAEIENEEEYLARPKRPYTDIRRTFENHLKSQPYPPPPNADEVMRIGMERKLDITLEMATQFFNKHQASRWKDERWKPILDWRYLLDNFVAAWNQNHYGANSQAGYTPSQQNNDQLWGNELVRLQ